MLAYLNSRRRRAVALAVTTALIVPATSVYAIGALVYDPSNYLQAVKQVQAWEQQYTQMKQALTTANSSLTQLKTQVSSMTGTRGFGDVFNNPALKSVVPADLSTTLASLNSTGSLTGSAASLRSTTVIYNCTDMTDAAAKTACQAQLGQVSQAQAVQQQTMTLLNQRTAQIEALRGEIDQTQDPKAIAELQARLAAEEAQVGNDQNKVILANAMLATSQQAAAQAQAERVNALMATNHTSALDGFSFASLGYQPTTQTASVEQ
jgi:type IV secretion system protein VirB5